MMTPMLPPATVDPPVPVRVETLWLHLLGELEGRRVLLSEGLPPTVRELLTAAGAEVAQHPMPSGSTGRGWDVVIGRGRERLAEDVAALAPTGRFVALTANARSPLRALRSADRPAPPYGVGTLAGVRSELRGHGLQPVQSFGVLRSAREPVIAFDLDLPLVTRAVLKAASVPLSGARAHGVRVLRTSADRSWFSGLLPGWLVLAVRGSHVPDPDRVTGMSANRDSREVKLIRGETAAIVEKRYTMPSRADAEAQALSVVAAAGLGLAPRMLRRPARDSVWMEWLRGDPLVTERMNADELVTWTHRAAEVLLRMQAATRRGDQVLVHGDYWLGNLLTQGDRVTGVIDWTKSSWGPVEADREKLLEGPLFMSPHTRRELRRRCARLFDGR